jgi:hypothetical protein
MISARTALLHHGFSVDSPTAAIQDVRTRVEAAKNPLAEASKIIFDIIGAVVKFTDEKTALHVAQYIVLTYVKNESYDEELAMLEATKKAGSLRTSENTAWCFAKSDTPAKRGETVSTVLDGSDTQVVVTKDGKIKKGGKQILCAELYKKYVLETKTPVTSKQFTAILEKQLGLSKSCSSTYSYNARKALGGVFAVAK